MPDRFFREVRLIFLLVAVYFPGHGAFHRASACACVRHARETQMKIKNHVLAVCICTGGMWVLMSEYAAAEPGCAASAHTQRLACEYDLQDDFHTRSAQCFDTVSQDPVCTPPCPAPRTGSPRSAPRGRWRRSSRPSRWTTTGRGEIGTVPRAWEASLVRQIAGMRADADSSAARMLESRNHATSGRRNVSGRAPERLQAKQSQVSTCRCQGNRAPCQPSDGGAP